MKAFVGEGKFFWSLVRVKVVRESETAGFEELDWGRRVVVVMVVVDGRVAAMGRKEGKKGENEQYWKGKKETRKEKR